MTVWIGLKSAKFKGTLQPDGRIIKTYTHVYLYRTDAGSRPGFDDIAADVGVAPGSPYADDANATAGEADIEHLPTRPPHCAAEVSITWATNNPAPAEDSTDPTTVHPIVGIKPIIQQRYITKDRLGKLILNGAKQPFDGGVPVDVRLGQVTLKIKVLASDFDFATIMKYSGNINSVTFLGGDPGTVQVDIDAEDEYTGGYHIVNLNYVFNYDPEGWNPAPANVGFFAVPPGGGPIVRITAGMIAYPPTSDTTKVPEPEPLDDEGFIVPVPNRPDDCNFIPVDFFPKINFDSVLPGVAAVF